MHCFQKTAFFHLGRNAENMDEWKESPPPPPSVPHTSTFSMCLSFLPSAGWAPDDGFQSSVTPHPCTHGLWLVLDPRRDLQSIAGGWIYNLGGFLIISSPTQLDFPSSGLPSHGIYGLNFRKRFPLVFSPDLFCWWTVSEAISKWPLEHYFWWIFLNYKSNNYSLLKTRKA